MPDAVPRGVRSALAASIPEASHTFATPDGTSVDWDTVEIDEMVIEEDSITAEGTVLATVATLETGSTELRSLYLLVEGAVEDGGVVATECTVEYV